jgi:alternate signal-mediated exported protein
MAEIRRSSRTTKALVAGAAAALLLVAGGGTFARWHAETPVLAQDRQFTSGELKVVANAGTWTDAQGATIGDPTAYLMAPGTTLTYTTTVGVTLDGAGMTGVLTTDFSGIAGTTALAEVLQVEVTLDGADMTAQGTVAWSRTLDKSGTHTLVMTVTFPKNRADGTDWGAFAQDSAANLTAFSISLTQG